MIRITVIYCVLIAGYYLFLYLRRHTVAPEVLNDALYDPMPGVIGGLLGFLMLIFFGDRIEAWKKHRRAQLGKSKVGFLAFDLKSLFRGGKSK